jgi:nitrate/nitrite-specific signal transduction histidine kinase
MSEQHLSREELFSRIEKLRQQLEEVNETKELIEILAETITEHATELENRILKQNQQMLNYLQQVEKFIAAAVAIENDIFEPATLDEVASRNDELGHLARVFQKMARQLQVREQKLKQQVEELKIEVDKTKKAQKVAEVVGSDSFQGLKQKLKKLKESRHSKSA